MRYVEVLERELHQFVVQADRLLRMNATAADVLGSFDSAVPIGHRLRRRLGGERREVREHVIA